jgi:hypothetical protein
MAAVDSIHGVDWLKTIKVNGRGILDKNGNFDGECPAYTNMCDWYGHCPDEDRDRDGVVDVCDECPDVVDPLDHRLAPTDRRATPRRSRRVRRRTARSAA